MSQSEWANAGFPVDPDSEERLFFTEHEWDTIEAATARIIPTDHDPGAREAGVVRFIDRYLSGIAFVYAAADGSGFLQIAGKHADAWRARVNDQQRTYREGVRRLDAIAAEHHGGDFVALDEEQQDHVLEVLSGAPRPAGVDLASKEASGAFQMGAFDEGLSFFDALVLHTRQGFYGDPVYGGNRDFVGWKVVGYPGPTSLKDTMDGTYSLRDAFVQEYDWEELIPHLKERAGS